jgi:hypothetical protein
MDLARERDAVNGAYRTSCDALHSFRLAGAALGICAWLLLACGENADPSDGRISDGGRSGSGGAADSVAGRGGRASQGGTPGSDLADAGVDAGMAASSGAGGGTATPPGCPEPTPIAATPDHPIVIQSVQFSRSEIVLRNVSQTTQTLAGGRRGWQWCNIPDYWNVTLAEEDIVLLPGDTYKFILLREDGRIRPLYPGDDPNDVNELGIYSTTGSFMTADLIEAFVSWGAGSNFGSRESVAVQGGVWTNAERIEIEPGHAGFIATGAADRGAGYTSVAARCLPANP